MSWRILAWNHEGPPDIPLVVELAPRALLQRLVVRLDRHVGWLQLEVAHRVTSTLTRGRRDSEGNRRSGSVLI